jgi:serine/threonine-protein kinase
MSHATPRRADANRNLLFGILARQMDFIGRDALIAAMNAWVLDKAKPLGQILREQGKLAEDEYALLEGLVRKHLEKHGNDPQRSLAALNSVGSVRQDLQQVADAAVQASLAHLSGHAAKPDPDATNYGAADPSATRGPAVGAPTSAGLRFRILRPHAEGGLGKVSVAFDEELRREVALKEILGGQADSPESRARFLLEAEITGGLEHPGVVPVYGLGQFADGRPFYAMRFIKGASLKDAIRRFHEAEKDTGRDRGQRALELRRLLGRFVDVCNTVAYAHSRGVLHRDLKPDNILLGPYGETLVVDWGLAKVVGHQEWVDGSTQEPLQLASGSRSDFTRAGSALGTPQYMSPEQAAGRLDQLGPAGDVYSLGAVLYCLLTGRPPFDGADVAAVLRQVREGSFQEPRVVNPSVPHKLESICLKAMSSMPEDRYPSALALADAVERWLADEPLSGYAGHVFTLSADGRATSLSPNFEARYGWSRDEWIGKHFAPLVHPEDLPRVMLLLQKALEGEAPPAFTVRVLTKSGQYVTSEILAIPQLLEGKVIGLMGISRLVGD